MTGNVLLTLGAVAIVAAIVGNGLKAFGVEIGVIASTKRQLMLFLIGLVFASTGLAIDLREGRAGETPRQVTQPAEPREEAPPFAIFDGKIGFGGDGDNSAIFAFLKEHVGDVVRIRADVDNSNFISMHPNAGEICFSSNLSPSEAEKQTGVDPTQLYNRTFVLPIMPKGKHISEIGPEGYDSIKCPTTVTFRANDAGPVWSGNSQVLSSWVLDDFFRVEARHFGVNTDYVLTKIDADLEDLREVAS